MNKHNQPEPSGIDIFFTHDHNTHLIVFMKARRKIALFSDNTNIKIMAYKLMCLLTIC